MIIANGQSRFVAALLRVDFIQAKQFIEPDDLQVVFAEAAGPVCGECLFRPVCPAAGGTDGGTDGDGNCSVLNMEKKDV